jgi:membrane associated rhomboid family serine protease
VTFLDRIERRFGGLAIPGLIRYVVGLNALVYLLLLVSPGYGNLLTLDREAIFSGQIWRLVTWIFLPNTTSPIWILFFLWFTWFVGEQLESVWGSFRLTAYYLLGVVVSTVAALVFGASGANFLLTLTLLLALATIAPNFQVLLLVFPIKLKWLAAISLAYPWGLYLMLGPLPVKAAIIVCLGNYLLFFGPSWIRRFRDNASNTARRTRFQSRAAAPETLHRCQTCGITEASHPDAEFRVASDGHEYCQKHIP